MFLIAESHKMNIEPLIYLVSLQFFWSGSPVYFSEEGKGTQSILSAGLI